jgi:hypothetical protein
MPFRAMALACTEHCRICAETAPGEHQCLLPAAALSAITGVQSFSGTSALLPEGMSALRSSECLADSIQAVMRGVAACEQPVGCTFWTVGSTLEGAS